jgi:hypothetical protein
MKNRNIKERKFLIADFAYKYREEILAIDKKIESLPWKNRNDSGLKEMISKLRAEVPYSPKTIDCDIWNHLIKIFKKVENHQNL